MAVVVIHAMNGVEVGTEMRWANATNLGISKMLVVNGFDREHTSFETILAEARSRFGNNVFPMQLPVNCGPGYNQNVAVLRKELITYQAAGSGKMSESELPEDLQERVEELHQ